MLNKSQKILIFHNKPQEFLPELQQRFPLAEFSTCCRYQDISETLTRVQPEITFACKFEPKPFPREVLLQCTSLKWLSVGFAGVDHVVPWDDEKITVTNVSGVAAQEMAQYAIAAIFGLFQRFPYFAKKLAARCWDFQPTRSATGACIGLIGFGHTGAAVAKMCSVLGLRTLTYRNRREPSPYVEQVYTGTDLNEMLAQCDVVVVCAALTPATEGLINANAIGSMKKGSFLINIARGPIIDEAAMISALKSGQLGGAVIDVACTEPLPTTDPLWDAPNLMITPHTSSEFEGWHARAATLFADNLERWQLKEPLLNRVLSDKGY